MKLLSALALSCLAVGCYDPSSSPRSVFRGIGEDPAPASPPSPTSPRVASHETQAVATFEGTLGSVRDFSATEIEVEQQAGGMQVELNSFNPSAGWWVMTQFAFSRPLSDPSWRVGQTYSFSSGVSAPSGQGLRVLSCSGPRPGMFTFDSSPSHTTMQIHEGSSPDTRMVTFSEYWVGSSNVVTGSFEYSLR